MGFSNYPFHHEYDPHNAGQEDEDDDTSCYHCGAEDEDHGMIKSHLNPQQFTFRKGQRTAVLEPHEVN